MRKVNRLKKFWTAKNGSEAAETTEINIGQLIASAFQVLIFVGIIVAFYSLTKKTAEAAGPQESFYQLITKLKELDSGRLPDGIGHAFYISENYYLFGFNAEPDEVLYNKGEHVEKPKPCHDTPIAGRLCVCICNKKDCSESASCNTRLQNGKATTVPFKEIKYLVVKAGTDPKGKLNKGAKLDPKDVPSGGNYLAIFGDSWKQGRVIFLKRNGNRVEITFPDVS